MSSVIHATGHGMSAGDSFQFANVVPDDCGIDPNHTYFVLASGLTADDFEFSETDGGAGFVLTHNITEGALVGLNVYTVVDDGNMTPPPTPSTPSAPTLASVLASDGEGHLLVHLRVTP